MVGHSDEGSPEGSHPLDGARAKLGRAEHHFEALRTEWQAFVDTEPYSFELKRNLNAQTIWVSFRVHKPIPNDIALIAGDVVQNLRAGLDYVATELVDVHGGDTTRSQFPIHVYEGGFITNVRYRKKTRQPGPLDRIPATSDEWAFIERLQPYQRGRWAKHDPLFALNYLSNRDKHRALTPAFGAPLVSVLDHFNVRSSQSVRYRRRYLGETSYPLEHGALLGAIDFSIPPTRDAIQMDMPMLLPIDIAFDEGVERRNPEQPYGLRRLIKHVRKIISGAEVFFL